MQKYRKFSWVHKLSSATVHYCKLRITCTCNGIKRALRSIKQELGMECEHIYHLLSISGCLGIIFIVAVAVVPERFKTSTVKLIKHTVLQ